MRTACRVALAVVMLLSVVGVSLASEPDVDPEERAPTAADATPQTTSSTDLAVFAIGEREFSLQTPITYTFIVVNYGPSAASGLKLHISSKVSYPGVAPLTSATSSQGTCSLDKSVDGGVVTCDLDSLPNDGRATVVIQVFPNAANSITRTATVVGDQDDPNTVNNRVSGTSWKEGPPLIIDPAGTPV